MRTGSIAVVFLLFGCSGSGRVEPARSAPGELVSAPAEERLLSPRERDRRGDEHLFAGRFDEAIADYDAFLAVEPAFDAHHWRRGIACYYAEAWDEGCSSSCATGR